MHRRQNTFRNLARAFEPEREVLEKTTGLDLTAKFISSKLFLWLRLTSTLECRSSRRRRKKEKKKTNNNNINNNNNEEEDEEKDKGTADETS